MKITRCKLIKNIRIDYLNLLEVTARSAADLLGIPANTAILFYRKIREVIAYHLEQDAHDLFAGAVELDESDFGGVRKGKPGRFCWQGGGVWYSKARWQGLHPSG